MKKMVKISQGTGYYALGRYPWGGEFRRILEDYEGEAEIFEGGKITVLLPGNIRAGFRLEDVEAIGE